jgi:hypothetical protein
MNASRIYKRDAPTTPTMWDEGNTFEDHDRIESAFGQLNCLFFVLGFTMNCLVAYSIKKKGIKSPVDVCTLMISMSNWLTVFLDLFVGISYINNKKPMAFGSDAFNHFWGFLKIVNHEWLAALLALLTLSNLINRTKLFIFLMGMAWLVIECILLTIPLTMGSRFQVYSFVPHPFPDHSDFLGGWMETGYMTWLFLTEIIPYIYFYLVTGALLLANIIQYSNMKQGFVEASPKKVQDTLTVIGYATFYLITDSPEIIQHGMWLLQLTILNHCTELYPVIMKLFYASLFINTIRAAAYPTVFFFSKYGSTAFIMPVKKVANIIKNRTSYRRFYGEDPDEETFRYRDMVDVESEEQPSNGQV